MRNLYVYVNICKEMLDALNIQYEKNVPVVVNKRLKSTWGRCLWTKHNNGYVEIKKIELNEILLDERNDEKGLIKTLLHEYLHTCNNCQNHGNEWLHYVSMVNDAYNLNIKEKLSYVDQGISKECIQEKRDKCWCIQCKKCGHIWYKSRTTNLVLNTHRYHCSCGGKLKIVQNKPGYQVMQIVGAIKTN